MKEIYKIILEFTPKNSRRDIKIIAITPGGKNNRPHRTYGVREYQFKRDLLWKTISA